MAKSAERDVGHASQRADEVTFSPKKDASLMMTHTVTEMIATDAVYVSWGG